MQAKLQMQLQAKVYVQGLARFCVQQIYKTR